MTDSDDRLARRYRELAREEPRAATDEAILAASRRAVAPARSSRRWAAPVSIAAVLVLAFGVTFEMEREEPDIASPASAPRAPPAAPGQKTAPWSAPSQESGSLAPAAAAPAAKPELRERRSSAPVMPFGTARKPVTSDAPAPRILDTKRAAPEEPPAPFPAAPSSNAAPTFAPAPAAAPVPSAATPTSSTAAPMPSPPAPARAAPAEAGTAASLDAAPAAAPLPAARRAPRSKSEAAPAARDTLAPTNIDRELERIAALRDAGDAAAADRALEDFRRAHPGYRIPDAVWLRVKAR